MNTCRVVAIVLIGIILAIISGCACPGETDELKAQNRLQQERIASLENDLSQRGIDAEECRKQLGMYQGKGSADLQAKDAVIAALEADIEKKKAMIAKMQAQLLQGAGILPEELNIMLHDFAKTSDMIDFDENTGMVKFKSDLLFSPGSDKVGPKAADSLKQLASILNSAEGKQFDMVIVGHTDDVPIKKPSTRQAHPTNWHLSVHRSISVMKTLTNNGIPPERVAVKGFGEYRPVEPNKPKKSGNPANRRVEIFVIPSSK